MKEQVEEDKEKALYERINKFYLAQYKMIGKISKYLKSTDVNKVRDVYVLSQKILLNGKNSGKLLKEYAIELNSNENISEVEKNEIDLIRQSFQEQLVEYKNYCLLFEQHYKKLEEQVQSISTL